MCHSSRALKVVPDLNGDIPGLLLPRGTYAGGADVRHDVAVGQVLTDQIDGPTAVWRLEAQPAFQPHITAHTIEGITASAEIIAGGEIGAQLGGELVIA